MPQKCGPELRLLKGEVELQRLFKGAKALATWDRRAGLLLGMLLRDSEVAKALSLTKTATGWNTYALPLQADGSSVEGLKVIVSDLVDVDTFAWVLDSTKNRLVVRQGTQITRTYIPQNDSWFISSVSRYGWDTLNPNSIVRVWNATP